MAILFKIPTVQEIYNQYHRQTFYVTHGQYPKPIVNFDKLLANKTAGEYIKKFQGLLSRNREAINWRLYIYSIAQYYKCRFDLKILSNLSGIKIYRTYIQSQYQTKDDEDDIYNAIINSLVFLNAYLRECDITFSQYLDLDRETIPLFLKQIYAGSISLYFLAAFDPFKVQQMLNYPNDLFQEYFSMNRDEFIEKFINEKHKQIMKYKKIKEIIEKLQKKFN